MSQSSNILAGTSRGILQQVEGVMNNKKIKTDKQRKRYLVEAWNHMIDMGVTATDDRKLVSLLKSYYGCITQATLESLTMDEAYKFVRLWSMQLCLGLTGWKEEEQ